MTPRIRERGVLILFRKFLRAGAPPYRLTILTNLTNLIRLLNMMKAEHLFR